jgi:hypothetical protein
VFLVELICVSEVQLHWSNVLRDATFVREFDDEHGSKKVGYLDSEPHKQDQW